MRSGGAFTLSVVDVAVTSVDGVALIGLHVLLWVQVAGTSKVNVKDA